MPNLLTVFLHPPHPRDSRGPALSSAPNRDQYFDVLKGFLVLVMVAHHTLEYFVGTSYRPIRYLDFVTGGFVFAAGFLTMFLLHRKPITNRSRVARRLLRRAANLLLVFVGANCLAALSFHRSVMGKALGFQPFLLNLPRVLLAGHKSGAVFTILIPIAYTLCLAGLLVRTNVSRAGVLCLTAASLALCALWQVPYNAYFVTIGLVGIAAGCVVTPDHVRAARTWPGKFALLVGSALYMWTVALVEQDGVLLYTGGIFLVLGAAYACADVLEPFTRVFSTLVTLGRHSLFSYVAQIIFLQIVARFAPTSVTRWCLGAVPALLTTMLLCALCFGLDSLKRREPRIRERLLAVIA
jgi:hypothetical protein